MPEAVIVDVVRTASGTINGQTSGWHPVDMAAATMQALLERNDADPTHIDEVILGCTMQSGAQSLNVGRNAILAAGWPEHISGSTIDRGDLSSQQAILTAVDAVNAGRAKAVIAGGVDVLSQVPIGASINNGQFGKPFGPSMASRYDEDGGLVPSWVGAEAIADELGLDRDSLDEYSVNSHRLAAAATDAGRFENEIVTLGRRVIDKGAGKSRAMGSSAGSDETIAADITTAALAELAPCFDEAGVVTAGNSAPLADSASAALVMSQKLAEQLSLKPRSRLRSVATTGTNPQRVLTSMAEASDLAIKAAGVTLDEIDLFEIHDVFAVAPLTWLAATDADPTKVNVHGGAIALGNSPGALGCRSLATLINGLEQREERLGLQVMCESGGTATALVIEVNS